MRSVIVTEADIITRGINSAQSCSVSVSETSGDFTLGVPRSGTTDRRRLDEGCLPAPDDRPAPATPCRDVWPFLCLYALLVFYNTLTTNA